MYSFDWLSKRAKLTPDKIALFDVENGQKKSYSMFNIRASAFANFLLNGLHLQNNDRIAILAYNSSEYMEILYGCAKANIIGVCLNWRLSTNELKFILKDSTPRVIVYDPDFQKKINELQELDFLENSIILSKKATDSEFIYESVLKEFRNPLLEMKPRKYEETWYLLYTSGTTGNPKGVIQTFGMVFYNAVNIGLGSNLTSEDVTLNLLPFFHTGGLNLYTNPTIHVGGTALIMKTFDPAKVLKVLSEDATLIFAVPAIYRLLSQHPDFEKTQFSRMREWECGGEKMPVPLLHTFKQKGIIIKQGFGMTETGPTVFLIDKEHAITKAGSVGKPMLHVEVRCVDENGNDLPPGSRGEMLIKGPGVTPGYWNQPQKTKEAIDKDGWLHSGDVIEVDKDGYYYIVDRIKDMFISGGENVYPAEIENVLYQIPQISEAAVIGISDEKWGEVGKAFVSLKPGQNIQESEIRGFLKKEIASYKIPKFVQFLENLPRNGAGKILKNELRKMK